MRAAPMTAILSLRTARTGTRIITAEWTPFAQNDWRKRSDARCGVTFETTPPTRNTPPRAMSDTA